LKSKHAVENPAVNLKRKRRDDRVNKRKRKRGPDQQDEETMPCSKRTRGAAPQERKQEVEEGQPVSVESTLSGRIVESRTIGFRQPVETPAAVLPLEGGPSWRSGVFPPLPPSQCFIRTLGFLYGGKGMHGFLLNRKMKRADGSRRLQGKDLVRMVFFEGLAYLNGLEKKPKKLPRRFFNMVQLFSQLLAQHRKCPYSRILQRMCPLVEESSAGNGEINSLLPKHCAPHRVYLFVRECLSAVIPQELWGSDHNRLLFFVRVRGFLRSGKFERLSLAELMWKMKVNDCDWLKISKTGEIIMDGLFFFLSFWLLHVFLVV